ncbi:uncharacterized protein MELLADRAFT_107460 [Melampsora larici-populina 98AG31]|uniref:Uncharacterized protein n=1 Tax=Melampsora larici-populina (strain 98AG31 / pathotype 3-4-7) TaxID=747676 RepID=F4RPW3_MELLP|nr:uncharacterized protein MELLADRAFT_107460 [Melampsora larici-populina 98AG31]EGG05669.1 hypothetical protein MELLADRAFT_107460 [Melampsora larici-populina 98AG31]
MHNLSNFWSAIDSGPCRAYNWANLVNAYCTTTLENSKPFSSVQLVCAMVAWLGAFQYVLEVEKTSTRFHSKSILRLQGSYYDHNFGNATAEPALYMSVFKFETRVPYTTLVLKLCIPAKGCFASAITADPSPCSYDQLKPFQKQGLHEDIEEVDILDHKVNDGEFDLRPISVCKDIWKPTN